MNKTMKEIINVCFVLMIVTVCFVIVSFVQTHYKREGFISYIDKCNDNVLITDRTGNLWEFGCDTEKFNVGDNVILSMHTNYTDVEIQDDIILKITLDK